MIHTIIGRDLAESLYNVTEGLRAMPDDHACILVGSDGTCAIIGKTMETMILEDAALRLETAILGHDSERERIERLEASAPDGVDPGAWAAAVSALATETEADKPIGPQDIIRGPY